MKAYWDRRDRHGKQMVAWVTLDRDSTLEGSNLSNTCLPHGFVVSPTACNRTKNTLERIKFHLISLEENLSELSSNPPSTSHPVMILDISFLIYKRKHLSQWRDCFVVDNT